MKKLVSLALVLALVLCLATVAFADEASSWQNPTAVDALPETVTLAAGEAVFYDVDDADLYGWILYIESENAKLWYGNPQWSGMMQVSAEPVGGVVSWEIAQNTQYDGHFIFGVENTGSDEATFTLKTKQPPVGAAGNPKEVSLTEANICMTVQSGWMWEYYYSFTPDKGGYLTIDVTNAIADTNSFDVILSNESNETKNYSWGENTIGTVAGETITVIVTGCNVDPNTYEESAAAVSFTASFVEAEPGEKYNPIVVEDKAKEYDFTATATNGAWTWYSLSDVKGATIAIEDADAILSDSGSMFWGTYFADSETGIVTYESYEDSLLIAVGTNGTDTEYTVSVSEPEGYDENPEIIDSIDEINADIAGGQEDYYYYQWTATETGKLTLNVADTSEWKEGWGEKEYGTAIDPESGEPYTDYSNPIAWYDLKVKLTAFVNGEELVAGIGGIVADVTKDDVVTLLVQVMPIEHEDYTDDYGGAAYVDIIGELAVLGSESNPYVINNLADLTGIDAASGDTYYVINSMLAGKLLVLEADENLTYTLNGKKVEAGEHELVPAGPTIRLVVTNADEEEIEIPAAIIEPKGSESNPVQVEAGESKAELAAGEEMHYIANSKMDGMTLAVKGEGAYIIVDGKKYEAKNGVASVVLKAAGPTISVIIGNAGTEAGNFAITVAFDDNANTGDASAIFTAIAAAVMSMTGTVALVAKKKEN